MPLEGRRHIRLARRELKQATISTGGYIHCPLQSGRECSRAICRNFCPLNLLRIVLTHPYPFVMQNALLLNLAIAKCSEKTSMNCSRIGVVTNPCKEAGDPEWRSQTH